MEQTLEEAFRARVNNVIADAYRDGLAPEVVSDILQVAFRNAHAEAYVASEQFVEHGASGYRQP